MTPRRRDSTREANQAAVELVADRVKQYNIACDFLRQPPTPTPPTQGEVQKIEAEVEAARKAGLPVEFVRESALPFPIAGAIRLDNQAQFHPRKYLLGLAQLIDCDGSYVWEQTKALKVEDGEPCRVTTSRGVLTADQVVIATHFPFQDSAAYFARMEPHRSYVLARDAERPGARRHVHHDRFGAFDPPPADAQRPRAAAGRRRRPQDRQGGRHAPSATHRIEAWAREHFPVQEVIYSWSTQDYATFDRVPFIGLAGPTSKNVYVATGFKGWGMTSGTLAGLTLCQTPSPAMKPRGPRSSTPTVSS